MEAIETLVRNNPSISFGAVINWISGEIKLHGIAEAARCLCHESKDVSREREKAKDLKKIKHNSIGKMKLIIGHVKVGVQNMQSKFKRWTNIREMARQAAVELTSTEETKYGLEDNKKEREKRSLWSWLGIAGESEVQENRGKIQTTDNNIHKLYAQQQEIIKHEKSMERQNLEMVANVSAEMKSLLTNQEKELQDLRSMESGLMTTLTLVKTTTVSAIIQSILQELAPHIETEGTTLFNAILEQPTPSAEETDVLVKMAKGRKLLASTARIRSRQNGEILVEKIYDFEDNKTTCGRIECMPLFKINVTQEASFQEPKEQVCIEGEKIFKLEPMGTSCEKSHEKTVCEEIRLYEDGETKCFNTGNKTYSKECKTKIREYNEEYFTYSKEKSTGRYMVFAMTAKTGVMHCQTDDGPIEVEKKLKTGFSKVQIPNKCTLRIANITLEKTTPLGFAYVAATLDEEEIYVSANLINYMIENANQEGRRLETELGRQNEELKKLKNEKENWRINTRKSNDLGGSWTLEEIKNDGSKLGLVTSGTICAALLVAVLISCCICPKRTFNAATCCCRGSYTCWQEYKANKRAWKEKERRRRGRILEEHEDQELQEVEETVREAKENPVEEASTKDGFRWRRDRTPSK